jgi:hypothetical protein
MAPPGPTKELCGFPTPKGKYDKCHNVAGMGTSHVGFGLCKKHGGTSKTNVKHAEALAARAGCKALGIPVSTNAFDALNKALAEANGDVEYFRREVEELDPDMYYVRPASILRRPLDEGKEGENPSVEVEEITLAPFALNIAIKELRTARDEVAKISKTIITLGLGERQVRVEEGRDRRAALSLMNLLTALGHKPEDENVRLLVRTHYPDAIDSTAEEEP